MGETSVILLLILLFLVNSLETANITLKFVSSKCHYDTDCGTNAYCKGNTNCACKDGYLPIDHNVTTCLKEAVLIGDPCIENIQCTAAFGTKAECYHKTPGSSGVCQCISNAHFHDDICYPSVSIGGHCRVSGECKVKSDIPVYCETGKCACPFYYHPNSNGSDCLPSSVIGEPCRNEGDCTTPNSRCFTICRCKINFVLSYDGKRCLPIADGLGSRCEEDGQCQEFLQNSVCNPIKKVCVCSPTSILRDGSCWSVMELGESCNDPRECVIRSKDISLVTCSNKTCKCASGYKPDFRNNDCGKGTSSPVLNGGQSFKLILFFNIVIYILTK